MEVTIAHAPGFDSAALACLIAEIDAVPNERTRAGLYRALVRVRGWREGRRQKGCEVVLTLAHFAQREAKRRAQVAGWRATAPMLGPEWRDPVSVG